MNTTFRTIAVYFAFASLTHCFGSSNSSNQPDGDISQEDDTTNDGGKKRKGDSGTSKGNTTCGETLCDIERIACTTVPCQTPCEACNNACKTVLPGFQTKCEEACRTVCSKPQNVCPRNCDQDYKACQKTEKNLICTDNFMNEAPSGEKPCTKEFLETYCKLSAHAQAVTYTLNQKCNQCDNANAWQVTCSQTACSKEYIAIEDAAREMGCQRIGCGLAVRPDLLDPYVTCLNQSISKPEYKECYDGALNCWAVSPTCSGKD